MPSNNYLSAIKSDFDKLSIESDGFNIEALVKNSGSGTVLTVYIEGDGQAWKNRYVISSNPTPKKSVALALATIDPDLKIAYLARPCMYIGQNDIKCKNNAIYWTSHRYSSEIIDSMSYALNELKKYTKTDKIKLVGFSGGGTIAILLAVFRNDILKITTIAANLDHVLWTNQHKVTPLHASLNASDYAKKVQNIPQVHFVGSKDSVVGEEIIWAYCHRMLNYSKTKIMVIEGYTHSCCWEDNWVELLKE
ncbi:MAG: alpha/beta hydrolase [Desulfamplus sp.]|nr:alpha/beta hydrolase [Desulfamplus sp.]